MIWVMSALCLAVLMGFAGLRFVLYRRLQALKAGLPKAYTEATQRCPIGPQVLPGMVTPRCLMPLCVDLMRRTQGTVAFENLTSAERRSVLHAYAVEEMPGWMVRLLLMTLRGSDHVLITQLYGITTSAPAERSNPMLDRALLPS